LKLKYQTPELSNGKFNWPSSRTYSMLYIKFVQIEKQALDEVISRSLIDFIQNDQKGAFRSSSVVEKGIELGVSKRTVDSYIKTLRDNGLLHQCKSGLYITSESAAKDNDLALARIALRYQPNAIVSLDSAANRVPLKEQTSGNIHVVTTSGRVGTMETPIGDIHIYSVSQRLQDHIRKAVGNTIHEDSGIKRHDPETSFVLAAYLGQACGLKSGYKANFVLDNSIDMSKVNSMASAISLTQEQLESTLYEVATSNEDQSSPSPY
jgi:predicted transcriptional regulator of viral defense system